MSCQSFGECSLKRCMSSSIICLTVAILDGASTVYKYGRSFDPTRGVQKGREPEFSCDPILLPQTTLIIFQKTVL